MDKGLGQRTPQNSKQVLNPSKGDTVVLKRETEGKETIQMPLSCLDGLGPLFQILDGLWSEADSSQDHNQNSFEIMLNESQAKHLGFFKGTVNVLNYSWRVKQKGV